MAVLQGLPYYNNKMIALAEHYDEFIIDASNKNPNIWHDRIPRGAYKLFSGMTQKMNVYRGGLPVQSGLASWKPLDTSRKPTNSDPGFDNCNPGTPHTYKYAWETLQYSGFKDEWQSEPICLNDMRFIDDAKTQLSLVVKTGVDYGVSILENWNREVYGWQAMLSKRGMMFTEGALDFEDNEDFRFDYDPFATTTDVDGNEVGYITFPATATLSTLNWSYLDYIRQSLCDRAPAAAIANEGGMPIYGLMIDYADFERMIKSDKELREDWRFAQPTKLIDDFNMGMKVYRHFALIHDARQMRFRVKGVENGRVVATRVEPLREGRQVTIGRVPESNPAYYRAEIGVGVIFMNQVFQNLFVPTIDNLGSGMTFGPAPGLTGQWQWINNRGTTQNILGETGYFYGRFELFPRPLANVTDATVFIYRRCAQTIVTGCEVEARDNASAGAVGLAADVVPESFDTVTRSFVATLNTPLKAGVGAAVTIDVGGTTFPAIIASDGLAPTYRFAWELGASGAPEDASGLTAGNVTVTAG